MLSLHIMFFCQRIRTCNNYQEPSFERLFLRINDHQFSLSGHIPWNQRASRLSNLMLRQFSIRASMFLSIIFFGLLSLQDIFFIYRTIIPLTANQRIEESNKWADRVAASTSCVVNKIIFLFCQPLYNMTKNCAGTANAHS